MEDTLKSRLESLKTLVAELEQDVQKSDEGTLSAGTRVRTSLQELKRLAQEARVFCLERDKTRKVK